MFSQTLPLPAEVFHSMLLFTEKKKDKKVSNTARLVQEKIHMMIVSSSVYCDTLCNTGIFPAPESTTCKETIKFHVPIASLTQGGRNALEVFIN